MSLLGYGAHLASYGVDVTGALGPTFGQLRDGTGIHPLSVRSRQSSSMVGYRKIAGHANPLTENFLKSPANLGLFFAVLMGFSH